jgi:hypothetical protein
MTPAELSIYINAHTERAKNEQQRLTIQAYMTAYFHRVKKMPNLKKLLETDKPKRKLTPAEMLEQVKKLNQAFGGKVVRKGAEEWQS